MCKSSPHLINKQSLLISATPGMYGTTSVVDEGAVQMQNKGNKEAEVSEMRNQETHAYYALLAALWQQKNVCTGVEQRNRDV